MQSLKTRVTIDPLPNGCADGVAAASRWFGGVALAILLALPLAGFASGLSDGVTVDDLLGRTMIRSFSLSPDGKKVAFLAIKAIPRKDVYDVRLYLKRTRPSSQPSVVAQHLLAAGDVYEANAHSALRTLSQYVWSPDSRFLLYTVHTTHGMELRVRNVVVGGSDKTLLAGHEYVEIEDVLPNQFSLRIRACDHRQKGSGDRFPEDPALLMKESYRFDLPLNNPKAGLPMITELWHYRWAALRATPVAKSRVLQYWPYPDEYSWNGHSLEILFHSSFPDQTQTVITGTTNSKLSSDREDLELDQKPEGTTVSVRQGSASRELHRENALLIVSYSEQTDRTRKTYLSEDRRLAVLSRSTNLVPDQLVLLNLTNGETTPLFSPNENFIRKTRGITIRLMPIPLSDGKLHGRLFLPPDYDGKKRYPLVFTTYLSTPGFNLGSGEVPILSLVAHDIAVFALDARETNEEGHDEDFGVQLRRLQRPLEAIEWVIERLTQEGVIDSERVGITGLSYGAEISMYAYWKSNRFRTVSSATGTWEPILYSMGGVGWGKFLHEMGFSDPLRDGLAKWKEFAAGLNARATLPPLLWQAPDAERQYCVESWFELRHAGAQVEWLEYPNEGRSEERRVGKECA